MTPTSPHLECNECNHNAVIIFALCRNDSPEKSSCALAKSAASSSGFSYTTLTPVVPPPPPLGVVQPLPSSPNRINRMIQCLNPVLPSDAKDLQVSHELP